MLALTESREPTMLVPVLERPDAEAAAGSAAVAIVDWTDGADPYQAAQRLLQPDGAFGISDSAWAMHLLGLQAALPRTTYQALTVAMPMMRAVKDDSELTRLAAARAAADAAFEAILGYHFGDASKRKWQPTWRPCFASSGMSRLISPSSVQAKTARIRTTRPATAGSGAATPWCWISAD